MAKRRLPSRSVNCLLWLMRLLRCMRSLGRRHGRKTLSTIMYCHGQNTNGQRLKTFLVQCVIAIHADTDNLHAHVEVNRVHPQTFQVFDTYRDYLTLHYAAREAEIKY